MVPNFPSVLVSLRLPILLFLVLTRSAAGGQDLSLVCDSVMNAYMESGQADKLFKPKGRTDKEGLRQGAWKDYQVEKDLTLQARPDYPRRTRAHYLIHGMGNYVDGKREGRWECYVIQDKTFDPVHYKQLDYVKGIAQGPARYFFPNDRVGFEVVYVDGQLHGPATGYYEDGARHLTLNFADGLQHGPMSIYYRDGRLKMTKTYVNDTAQGPCLAYYPDGKLQEEFSFDHGKEHGTYRYYHPNGALWVERMYAHGRLWNISGTYDPQGNRREVGTLKDGNGTVNFYENDGTIYSVVTYKDGERVSEEQR